MKFKQMVKGVREVEENKKEARKSIIAKVDIPEGTIIIEEMLGIKRPGTGLEPRHIDKLVGRKAKRHIQSEEFVTSTEVV